MTSLDGTHRCIKTDLHIALVGELDELNCQVGIALSDCCAVVPCEYPKLQYEMINALQVIQNDLFDIGGSLVVKTLLVKHDRIDSLEQQVESWLCYLPEKKEFILPGGHRAAGQLHLTRAVCRRVERRWWQTFLTLQGSLGSSAMVAETPTIESTDEDLPDYVLYLGQYLNRLSDWFFVAARLQNQIVQYPEVLWKHSRKKMKNTRKGS